MATQTNGVTRNCKNFFSIQHPREGSRSEKLPLRSRFGGPGVDRSSVASGQPGHHCPFLNRADARCGENFSLERLDHAYEYCFHKYKTCAIYHQLLVERQVKRITASQ